MVRWLHLAIYSYKSPCVCVPLIIEDNSVSFMTLIEFSVFPLYFRGFCLCHLPILCYGSGCQTFSVIPQLGQGRIFRPRGVAVYFSVCEISGKHTPRDAVKQ